jgi:hypothetical protein
MVNSHAGIVGASTAQTHAYLQPQKHVEFALLETPLSNQQSKGLQIRRRKLHKVELRAKAPPAAMEVAVVPIISEPRCLPLSAEMTTLKTL